MKLYCDALLWNFQRGKYLGVRIGKFNVIKVVFNIVKLGKKSIKELLEDIDEELKVRLSQIKIHSSDH